jgi:hypothetical protein
MHKQEERGQIIKDAGKKPFLTVYLLCIKSVAFKTWIVRFALVCNLFSRRDKSLSTAQQGIDGSTEAEYQFISAAEFC